MADNVGLLVNLPNRRSFSPDVAFWTGGPLTGKFLEGAPVFAVEVRSYVREHYPQSRDFPDIERPKEQPPSFADARR